MNQRRMRFLTAVWVAAVLAVVSVCDGSILDMKVLEIDLTNTEEAKGKASWSPSDKLSITKRGLGWDGDGASSYDGWIQTKPMPLGLSWRPPYTISVRFVIQPPPTEITLNSGQKTTPYGGDVYVRYSPDLKHWSSCQALQHANSQTSDEKKNSGTHFSGTVRVPYRERNEYQQLLSEYSRLDVRWKSDEEAAVRWILKRKPDFFSKQIPFIGYVEFLYEGSFHGGQRIQRLKAQVSYGMSGEHSPPKDNAAYKDRDSIPWRFQARDSRLGLRADNSIFIASIKPDPTTEKHVAAVLQKNGIPFRIGGEFVYGVLVLTEKKKQAVELLRGNAYEKNYWINFETDFPKSKEATAASSKEVRRLVERLSNSDIDWDHKNWRTVVPHFKGETAKSLLQLGTDAIPALVDALDDPKKFAAAHVLLTWIQNSNFPIVQSIFVSDATIAFYNHMRIDFRPEIDFHPEQRAELKRFWLRAKSQVYVDIGQTEEPATRDFKQALKAYRKALEAKKRFDEEANQ